MCPFLSAFICLKKHWKVIQETDKNCYLLGPIFGVTRWERMRLRFLMVYLSIKFLFLEPGNILSCFKSKINFKIKNRSKIYSAMFRLWRVSICWY